MRKDHRPTYKSAHGKKSPGRNMEPADAEEAGEREPPGPELASEEQAEPGEPLVHPGFSRNRGK